MPFEIVRNDITKMKVDAIVNTANPKPVVGSGVDSAIYSAAGKELLLAERKKIGEMKRGQAAITPAFDLSAKYIIHTVGPRWDENNKESSKKVLEECYINCVSLAIEHKCESIAFPLISSGNYRFPKFDAIHIAFNAITKLLEEKDYDIQVYLVVYDNESLGISEELIGEVASYIGDEDVIKEELFETKRFAMFELDPPNFIEESACKKFTRIGSFKNIELPPVGESFQTKLFKYIDERGIERDSEVYLKANMDRRAFSKIRKEGYHPSKGSAISLAIALRLDIYDTNALLETAGYILSNSIASDRIVTKCIKEGCFNVGDVNGFLFENGEKMLSKYE